MNLLDSIKITIAGLQALPQMLKEIQDARQQLQGYTDTLREINRQLSAILSKFAFK